MRKPFLIIVCTLVAISCNKEIVTWDITPVGIEIAVTNDNGASLIDSLASSVTATFMGETYNLTDRRGEDIVSSNPSDPMSPTWYGFAIYGQKIYFGEFPGTDTFNNENLIIDWGDSTKDTITIRNIVHDTDSCWVDRAYYLNGEKVKYQFDIIK
jgi:hypothetical protein